MGPQRGAVVNDTSGQSPLGRSNTRANNLQIQRACQARDINPSPQILNARGNHKATSNPQLDSHGRHTEESSDDRHREDHGEHPVV